MTLVPCTFVAAAQALLGFGETNDATRGHFVDSILREAGLPQDAPWDLAFVQHVGWWSQWNAAGGFSLWPWERSRSHRDLAAIAEEKRITRPTPRAGDIVLYWSDSGGYAWSGIIAHAGTEQPSKDGLTRFRCIMIEGNLTAHGVRGGPYVRQLTRTICPARRDLFIRWMALDSRRAVSDPALTTITDAGRLVLLDAGPELVR